MSEKRFRLRFSDGDNGEVVSQKGVQLSPRQIVDLLNSFVEENEQLQQTVNSQQLTITNKQSIIIELFEQKGFCEEMAQNLKEDNEQLKKDKKILDSIKKRHNCSNCVKIIENNNYCYCLKQYKEVTEDEICENYRYWR